MTGPRLFGPGEPRLGESVGAHPRTALPVFRGVPRYLEAHLQRLLDGAAALGQSAEWLPGLQHELEHWLLDTCPVEPTALRLRLWPDLRLLEATLDPLPAAPQPYRLVPLPHPLGNRRTEASIVHKGLGGPWGKDVLHQARQQGAEDGLLLWPDGTLAETAIASVAIEADGQLLLPPPTGRVASLAERLDLPGWAESRGLRITAGDISPGQAGLSQVWCLNALRGIWRATLL